MSEKSSSYEAVIVHKDVHDVEVMLMKERQVQQIKDQFLAANIFDSNVPDRETNVQRIIGGLGHGENTVEGYNNSLKNANRAEGREKIDEADLNKLADAAALAVIESGIADVQDDSVLGGLDRHLPDALKGLEGRVQKRMISCEQLVPIAQEMRDLREIFDLNMSSGRKSYNERTVQLLQETSQLNRRLRETPYELEWKTLMAYLAQERERSEEKKPVTSVPTRIKPDKEDVNDNEETPEIEMTEGQRQAKAKRDKRVAENEKALPDKLKLFRDIIGSRSKEIPYDNPEILFRFTDDVLDFIEGSGYESNDLQISGESTNYLNAILDEIKGRGKTEKEKEQYKFIDRMIRTRLAVHDTEYFMDMASGGYGEKGGGVVQAIGDIGRRKRFITRDMMYFLFKDWKVDGDRLFNGQGVDLGRSWDLVEEANFNYLEMMAKAGVDPKIIEQKRAKPATEDPFYGKKYWGFTYDEHEELGARSSSQTQVREYMIAQLGSDTKARKAMQIAEKFIVASSEKSVFNAQFIDGDDFSEMIHFGKFREDESRKGKPGSGPKVTRHLIKSLTPGWIRYFCKEKDPDKMIKTEDILKGLSNLEGKKDFWAYFTAIVNQKVKKAKVGLQSKDAVKPGDMRVPLFEGTYDAFMKCTVEGNELENQSFFVDWLAGVLQSSNNDMRTEWIKDDFKNVRYLATKYKINLDEYDEPEYRHLKKILGPSADHFMTEEQWNWIVESLNLGEYFVYKDSGSFVKRMFSRRR
ncbi:MAG: hypothetical protein Q8P53_02920 [Candidatus Shapirobacteria bacterium]|nr:hypothetical protein [Candidatus Shapirobacteria bacterium]